MRKRIIGLIIFLTIFLLPYTEVMAAGCGYICNSTTDNDETYCKKSRGANAYLGTTFSIDGTAACPDKKDCGLGSVAVCCCVEATSVVTPQGTNAGTCNWVDKVKENTLNGNCPTGQNTCAETSCAGAKPDNNKICCGKPIATALIKTEPKFKLPDYKFQIPIGNLSKLTTVDCSKESCEIPFISQYIAAVYKYSLSIAGVLGVLMLMGAGLLYLVSAGDSEKIMKAKKMISGSLFGILLLVGLNFFLSFINPDLMKNKSIIIDNIERKDLVALAEAKLGGTAENYKKKCATDAELAAGTDFYATGYYKVEYRENQTNYYLCDVHMQGTCPNGVNESGNCYENGRPIFPAHPNYKPCHTFNKSQYQNYFSASDLIVGKTIAGPKCPNLEKNDQVCFKGKTYTITDSGGAIQGKRIDILSASVAEAYKNTGVGKLTIGACK